MNKTYQVLHIINTQLSVCNADVDLFFHQNRIHKRKL